MAGTEGTGESRAEDSPGTGDTWAGVREPGHLGERGKRPVRWVPRHFHREAEDRCTFQRHHCDAVCPVQMKC